MEVWDVVAAVSLAVSLDGAAWAAALTWAHGRHFRKEQPRAHAVVERLLLAVHMAGMAVLVGIGTLVQWHPRPLWLVLILVLVMLLVLYALFVRAARMRTSGAQVAVDLTTVEQQESVQSIPSPLPGNTTDGPVTNAEAQEIMGRTPCDCGKSVGWEVAVVYTSGPPCHHYLGRCRKRECSEERDFSFRAEG